MLMVTGGVMLMATGGVSPALTGSCPAFLGSAKKTRPGGIAPLGGSPFSVKYTSIVFFADRSISGNFGEDSLEVSVLAINGAFWGGGSLTMRGVRAEVGRN